MPTNTLNTFEQMYSDYGKGFILGQIKSNLGLMFNDSRGHYKNRSKNNLRGLFAVAQKMGFHDAALTEARRKHKSLLSSLSLLPPLSLSPLSVQPKVSAIDAARYN